MPTNAARRASAWLLSGALALMLATPASPTAQAQTPAPSAPTADVENVMIILDASYSMSERLTDGETKMMAAKRTLWGLLRQLPPNVNVGLRVYGTSPHDTFTACRATQTLAPIAAGNRTVIANQLIRIQPTGLTPITYTLQRSLAEDFIGATGMRRIILVSDGLENCSADPCDVAVAMARGGVDIKIDVVGFGLQGLEAGKQLRCIALSTFGKYYTANTAAELARSMGDALRVDTSVAGQIVSPGKPSGAAAAAATPAPPAPAVRRAPAKTPAAREKEYDATRAVRKRSR